MKRRLLHLLALLGVSAFLASACLPGLREAFYTCEDGVCPESFFCAPDGLCHHEPLPMYSDCTSDEQCASGDCHTGIDTTNDDPAQCSASCADDTDCPDSGNAQGRCALGHCLVGCQQPVECLDGTQCLGIPMTQAVPACFHLQNPDYGGVLACGEPRPPCLGGLSCLTLSGRGTVGACVWPCGKPTDLCPFGSECTMLPVTAMPQWACLAPCVMDQDCREGLKCLAYPSATKHCVPELWP